MIRVVRIRGFKRFREVEFRLPGHVVLAGPNNTGKTTVLQAIASWSLAFQRWRQLDDFNPRRGYARAPIARQAFVSVPLGTIADNHERSRLVSSLRVLSNTDVMQALDARGVLYVEDYTDVNILRAWAARLGHRALGLLTTELMWRPVVFQAQEGRPGIRARDHFEALQLVRQGLPGLEIRDGDAQHAIPDTDITGTGLQRLRWRRYEIESYLVYPAALTRFVESLVGAGGAASRIEAMDAYLRREFPPGVVDDPLGDHEFLNVTKARTRLIRPLLAAAGIRDLPYTRYHEIAELMDPTEIHPEVVEKLDAICRAFGVEP